MKMSECHVNRHGYLVAFRHTREGLRTYACTDRAALDALILHLTGREASTYDMDMRGLPRAPDARLVISEGLHIWGTQVAERDAREVERLRREASDAGWERDDLMEEHRRRRDEEINRMGGGG